VAQPTVKDEELTDEQAIALVVSISYLKCLQTQLEGKLHERPLAKELLDMIPVTHYS
jgi:hypothetical protein